MRGSSTYGVTPVRGVARNSGEPKNGPKWVRSLVPARTSHAVRLRVSPYAVVMDCFLLARDQARKPKKTEPAQVEIIVT